MLRAMRSRSLRLVLLLPFAAALAACAPGAGLPPLPPAPSGAYRLGPGDQVRIITLADEALTGTFRVSDSGDVALPLLGGVRAAGRTPSGLAQAISTALVRDGLERAPSVAVEVRRYRPIFVLGEVNKPGEFPYQPGMTLLSAVALAGGFTYRAVEDVAEVVRTTHGRVIAAKATPESELAPGDVVTVFERRF